MVIAAGSLTAGNATALGYTPMKVVKDRTAAVGWPHTPSVHEQRVILRRVLQHHVPRGVLAEVRCVWRGPFVSPVKCFGAYVLAPRRIVSYVVWMRVYEDGSYHFPRVFKREG